MMGHLNLAFAPFIPLAVLVAVKFVLGDLRPKGFVVLLGLTSAAEFLTSTELYLDLLLVGVLFIAVFYAVDAARRERLNELIRFGGVGVALSLLIVSPYLWHAFVSSGIENAPLRSPYSEATDLANFVVPTRLVWLQLPGSARIAGHFTATGAERGGYLGIPLLVVMLLYVWRSRGVPAVRALAVGFALTALATLGSEIRVGGHSVVPAPWRVLAKLPVTRTILPVRLTVFLALLAALAVAAFLARSGVWGWALVGLGVLFLLPNPAGGRWNSPVPNPRFFASRLYRDHVPRRANVLAFPYGGAGWSLLWQAEDGFSYNLVGGHFGRTTIPAERRWKPVYVSFGFHQDPAVTPAVFKRFVAAHRIGTITVATGTTFHVRRLVASLGVRPKRSGDVLVYTLS
jgi:hypothetical protein